MSTSVVNARIDTAVRDDALAVLSRYGLTMSEAIREFLGWVAQERGLPEFILSREAEVAAKRVSTVDDFFSFIDGHETPGYDPSESEERLLEDERERRFG